MQAEKVQALRETEEMVAGARKVYYFWSRNSDETLVRRRRACDRMERLVDGNWKRCRAPRLLRDCEVWTGMACETLVDHARRYFVEDFARAGLGRGDPLKTRLLCGALGRWLFPSPRGGEGLCRANEKAAVRSVEMRFGQLRDIRDGDLIMLREEAETGHARELERNAAAEQRASFFLGAAGLTTSLILANAGLLLGDNRLEAPWRVPAAAVLTLASACAILSGFRATQVSASQFQKIYPTSAGQVIGRGRYKGGDRVRSYVAGLLISSSRESAIAEWKFARLASARRWFFGVIGGVVLLTAIVLAEALC
jgi:hypothetical protein